MLMALEFNREPHYVQFPALYVQKETLYVQEADFHDHLYLFLEHLP